MARSDLPPVFVTISDYDSLFALARRTEGQYPAAPFLLSELRRAVVCRPEELPEDTVTMRCLVTYRINEETETKRRFLTYPDECHLDRDALSVLAPLGAALIGLRSGSRMPYQTPGCLMECYVTVDRVEFRPTAGVNPGKTEPPSDVWYVDDTGPEGAP